MSPARQRVGRGLPIELTSFVGRRHELAQARESLGSTRLLTLIGPGGVGKTRLALRLAATMEARFAGGVCLVELADVEEPEMLADKVASTLGLIGDPNAQPWDDLEAFVEHKHLLLGRVSKWS